MKCAGNSKKTILICHLPLFKRIIIYILYIMTSTYIALSNGLGDKMLDLIGFFIICKHPFPLN